MRSVSFARPTPKASRMPNTVERQHEPHALYVYTIHPIARLCTHFFRMRTKGYGEIIDTTHGHSSLHLFLTVFEFCENSGRLKQAHDKRSLLYKKSLSILL